MADIFSVAKEEKTSSKIVNPDDSKMRIFKRGDFASIRRERGEIISFDIINVM